MFNKPAGCITAKSDREHVTVMDYFKDIHNPKLHPIGRLDKDTEGLLLITDDGQFNQYLMQPDNHVEKTYFFWAMGELTHLEISLLENGVMLLNETKKTKPAKVTIDKTANIGDIKSIIKGNKYRKIGRNPINQVVTSGYITITEGKKHQIKRMLKAVGCYCVYLKRISIGDLILDKDLEYGKYRELTEGEVNKLIKKQA